MSARLKTVGALLGKDLITLWPLVVLATVSLTALVVKIHTNVLVGTATVLLYVAACAACGLLVIAVIQTDAPRRLREDWLVRPIPPSTLLWAKGLFIAAVLAVPVAIGVVIAGVRDGTPLGEILLVATSIKMWLVVGVTLLCVVAALTASVTETLGALVGLCVLLLVVSIVDISLSGPSGGGLDRGPLWTLGLVHIAVAFTVAGAVGWLAYVRRSMVKAWGVFVGALLLEMTLLILVGQSGVFAVQKLLSPDPAAADAVRVTQIGDCLPVIRVDPTGESVLPGRRPKELHAAGSLMHLASSLWSAGQRRDAGDNAIGFETRAEIAGMPEGWRTVVDGVLATYVDADGRTSRPLTSARGSMSWSEAGEPVTAVRFWLLPRAEYQRLAAADVKLHLDYALTLVRPMTSASLAIDDKRHYVAGFGYCGAVADSTTKWVEVDCFRRGSQAGQFSAALVEKGKMEMFSGTPSYLPSFLQFLSGQRHTFKLFSPEGHAKQVTLTRYAAVAHFDREFVATGVLGGSAAACPAP